MQPVSRRSVVAAPTSVTGCPGFDYAPGQPNLYLMMRFKQDLVASCGLDQGFEMFKRRFGLPAATRLRDAVVENERAFAEQGAEFFAETARAGEPFVHLPPTVIGEGNHASITGTTRSQYVACLGNARVSGRSALIDVNGRLLLDVQGDEAQRLDDELEWDPAIFHFDGMRTWFIESVDASQPMEVDEAFSLLGAHTDFFGHWMCEYLPKYIAAKLSGLLPNVPVLIDSHMPSSHREALECLYGTSYSAIEVPAFRAVRVDKLWCAPTLSYMPLHEIRNERFSWQAVSASPSRFEPIIRDMQRRFDDNVGSSYAVGPRVYLARKAFRHRRLVNHAAIEQVAGDLGFEIVYPEDLTFSEQAKMARNADIIIAPEGSAIFLSVFARPGTTLCILSHPLTDVLADYNGLFAAHHIEVMAITGPIARANSTTPHDSDYRIDEETFRRIVGQLVRAGQGRGVSG